jgi:hypothetical protein
MAKLEHVGLVQEVAGKNLIADTEIERLANMPTITVSDTEPEDPEIGDLWIDTSE